MVIQAASPFELFSFAEEGDGSQSLSRSLPLNHLKHLTAVYPDLSDLLDRVPPLEILTPQSIPIAEAVTKIVVGQMLSRAAADSIYSRLTVVCEDRGLEGSWKLAEQDLLSCGLSRRKVRAIREFGAGYASDRKRFEAWRTMSHLELRAEVSAHWGLSQWSADMLSIFYFAMPDVFPERDGSIIRAMKILEEHYLAAPLDPQLASPFRTYLARYLWALVDGRILKPG